MIQTIIGRTPVPARRGAAAAASKRGRLQLGLGPLVVGVRVGDDATADAEYVVAPGTIVNVRIATASSAALAVAVDPADGAAVDAAPHGSIFDRLHHTRGFGAPVTDAGGNVARTSIVRNRRRRAAGR